MSTDQTNSTETNEMESINTELFSIGNHNYYGMFKELHDERCAKMLDRVQLNSTNPNYSEEFKNKMLNLGNRFKVYVEEDKQVRDGVSKLQCRFGNETVYVILTQLHTPAKSFKLAQSIENLHTITTGEDHFVDATWLNKISMPHQIEKYAETNLEVATALWHCIKSLRNPDLETKYKFLENMANTN